MLIKINNPHLCSEIVKIVHTFRHLYNFSNLYDTKFLKRHDGLCPLQCPAYSLSATILLEIPTHLLTGPSMASENRTPRVRRWARYEPWSSNPSKVSRRSKNMSTGSEPCLNSRSSKSSSARSTIARCS